MKSHDFSLNDIVYEKADSQRKYPMTITHWGKKMHDESLPIEKQKAVDDYEKAWCEWKNSHKNVKRKLFAIVNLVK